MSEDEVLLDSECDQIVCHLRNILPRPERKLEVGSVHFTLDNGFL